MPLPSAPPLSITQIQAEFGAPAGTGLAALVAGGAYVPAGTEGDNGPIPSAPPISVSNFYGAQAGSPPGVYDPIDLHSDWTVYEPATVAAWKLDTTLAEPDRPYFGSATAKPTAPNIIYWKRGGAGDMSVGDVTWTRCSTSPYPEYKPQSLPYCILMEATNRYVGVHSYEDEFVFEYDNGGGQTWWGDWPEDSNESNLKLERLANGTINVYVFGIFDDPATATPVDSINTPAGLETGKGIGIVQQPGWPIGAWAYIWGDMIVNKIS